MKRLLLAAATTALACGGGHSLTGSATVSGPIGGETLTPRDAAAAHLSYNASGVPGSAVFITVTSATGFCSLVQSGKEPKSAGYLVLTAFQRQPDSSTIPPPAPGTYTVGNAAIHDAVVVFAKTDATCKLSPAVVNQAINGQIDFTSVGSRYAGSFLLTFQSGGEVQGTFDAPLCGGVTSLQPGTAALACE